MATVPLSVALVAGGLAVLNPCGFPFLPAFLSFYVGTDERSLPRAPNRILQGIVVGAAVAAGFLGVFALIALPITYGVRLVAELVPGSEPRSAQRSRRSAWSPSAGGTSASGFRHGSKPGASAGRSRWLPSAPATGLPHSAARSRSSSS